MDHQFSALFHESSKDKAKGHSPIPADPANAPEEWKTIFFKTYPRLPKIELGDAAPRADYFDLLRSRSSQRNFSGNGVSQSELGTILKYSCGEIQGNSGRRVYPSAGARFPIETYVVIARPGPGLSSGVYHYDVRGHRLNVLEERIFGDDDLKKLFAQPWVKNAAFCIVFTAVFKRNQMKYGERGYRYILLEAGYIGQNVYLVSEALRFKCCALAGTNDEKVEELLDIDGITESVIHALVVGK